MESYTLNPQDVEKMLQEKYGEKIRPVSQSNLQKQKNQQYRMKQASLLFKKSNENKTQI